MDGHLRGGEGGGVRRHGRLQQVSQSVEAWRGKGGGVRGRTETRAAGLADSGRRTEGRNKQTFIRLFPQVDQSALSRLLRVTKRRAEREKDSQRLFEPTKGI